MKRYFLVAAILLGSFGVSNAQTLVETFAFLRAGGLQESFPAAGENAIRTDHGIVRTIDADNCVMELDDGSGLKRVYRLNNVVRERTENNYLLLILRGDDDVLCEQRANREACHKSFIAPIHTPRVFKALDYLYSRYCKYARSKSAF